MRATRDRRNTWTGVLMLLAALPGEGAVAQGRAAITAKDHTCVEPAVIACGSTVTATLTDHDCFLPDFYPDLEIEAFFDGWLFEGTAGSTVTINLTSDEFDTDPLAHEAVFAAALDRVLARFAPLDALIIDIRLNGGGHDNLALALAGRLTDRVRLGFAKQARTGGYDEFAEPTRVFFGPRPQRVNFLGRPAILPNGWEFEYSNERYLSPEKPPRDYERMGIAPHVLVRGSQEALDQGRDNILEQALQVLDAALAAQDAGAFAAHP